jgi:hypothetical protein
MEPIPHFYENNKYSRILNERGQARAQSQSRKWRSYGNNHLPSRKGAAVTDLQQPCYKRSQARLRLVALGELRRKVCEAIWSRRGGRVVFRIRYMRLKPSFPYHQIHSTAVDMGGIIIICSTLLLLCWMLPSFVYLYWLFMLTISRS